MKRTIILLTLIIPLFSYSQSLGEQRLNQLNSSVVRVLIDSLPSGTGFFVNEDWLVTCHHVIEPAYIRDSLTNNILSRKRIFVEFNNGEVIEVGIMRHLQNDGYNDALAYDYCILKINTNPSFKINPLVIGDWTDIKDGDEIYSCGYPLGIEQAFRSKGILSSKWKDKTILYKQGTPVDTLIYDVAWLDLTMNKGNSGGPIIKFGNSPEEDRVIGIATFILNPYAKSAKNISNYLPHRGIDLMSDGISQNQMLRVLYDAISNNSIGVSGCISIDYSSKLFRQLK
nr:serine protease [uncultured Draconibacterium sp.]